MAGLMRHPQLDAHRRLLAQYSVTACISSVIWFAAVEILDALNQGRGWSAGTTAEAVRKLRTMEGAADGSG